ncbi:uncharacterized protein LOC135479638 [Liolophura sinensis]|uniref:uncharacterized protein LOC135479638 n=1 Tax=Liolophura sinensis TaxID=3198878 RepID=UPI0031595270
MPKGKMMRKFIVTKPPDREAAKEDDAEVGVAYEEPLKRRYATRILFILLLASGAVLISCGVTLLVTCRAKVTKETCRIVLNDEQCSYLAVSAYFGCVLILATVFGFGCVGRKAMAVMLLPLLLGELVFGIYVLLIEKPSIDSAVLTDLSSRKSQCFGFSGNRTTHHHDSTTPFADPFQCWQQRTMKLASCKDLWLSLGIECHAQERNQTGVHTQLSASDNDALLRNCSAEVAKKVSGIVWSKRLTVGPILIVISQVHLVSAICLWFLRKTTSGSRGLGLIPLPNLPRRFSRKRSRSKANAQCGTSDQSHQSLILQPDDTLGNMQKYVFKKLRRQKNTYATV